MIGWHCNFTKQGTILKKKDFFTQLKRNRYISTTWNPLKHPSMIFVHSSVFKVNELLHTHDRFFCPAYEEMFKTPFHEGEINEDQKSDRKHG